VQLAYHIRQGKIGGGGTDPHEKIIAENFKTSARMADRLNQAGWGCEEGGAHDKITSL
jgi:hypothetical protein